MGIQIRTKKKAIRLNDFIIWEQLSKTNDILRKAFILLGHGSPATPKIHTVLNCDWTKSDIEKVIWMPTHWIRKCEKKWTRLTTDTVRLKCQTIKIKANTSYGAPSYNLPLWYGGAVIEIHSNRYRLCGYPEFGFILAHSNLQNDLAWFLAFSSNIMPTMERDLPCNNFTSATANASQMFNKFGKLLTWHSYMPWSRRWTNFICNVHVLEPGVCNMANRSSFVYIWAPDDNICQSLRRIHDIWFCATSQPNRKNIQKAF